MASIVHRHNPHVLTMLMNLKKKTMEPKSTTTTHSFKHASIFSKNYVAPGCNIIK